MTKQFKTVNEDGSYVLREFYYKKKNLIFPEKSGLKYEQSFDANGKPHGDCTLWTQDGKLSEKSSYLNGKPHGTWIEYDKDTGREIKVENYAHGELNGLLLEYYRVHPYLLKSTAYYENNELNGECIEYHPNGRPRKISYYKDSELHGTVKELSSEGRVVEVTNYNEDYVEGLKIRYSRDGETVLSEENYKTGNLHGECRCYHPDGKIKEIRSYSNGTPQGLRSSYDVKTGEEMRVFVLNGLRITKEQSEMIYKALWAENASDASASQVKDKESIIRFPGNRFGVTVFD